MEKVRLSKIAVISAGQGAPQGTDAFGTTGTPFIKAGDLADLISGKQESEIQQVSNSIAEKYKLKLYPAGSVLFAKSGMSCMKGYVYKTTGECYVVSHLAIINPVNCNGDYLKYYFQYRKPNTLVKDEAYPSISLNDIGNMEISLPNEQEQKNVAYILDKVSHLIDTRQEQLKKLDELVKARFVELFGDPVVNEKGWDTKPLLEMGSCKNGMNFHYEDSGVEINCLGVGDFKDYSIISDTSILPTVSLNEMPSADYMLQDDDIVFVRSNGNKALVGRSVAVYPGKVPTTFSGFCIRYRKTDEAVNIPYLLRVLKAESVRQKMAGRGANIQNLNQQILGTLIIPVPPIELQNQFAAFVEQTDKSKLEIQKSLEKLELLKKALMQKYFG